MADNTREQERNELHNTIWKLATELRGSVDGWDFKQYVLGMLFYRYISENFAAYINAGERDAGNPNFDYASLNKDVAETAREDMVKTKGFFILPEQLFCNLLKRIDLADKNAKEKALKEGKEVEIAELDENLNEVLQENFKSIEASAIGTPSESNFKGLFDDIDVNSNKLGPTVIKRNKRLKKLISVIGSMNLGEYQDNCIDAFGDTYEYLMGMYASAAGKSGGEFFTPQEVSELLTKLSLLDYDGKMKTEVNKVYDPAVGSGSLLLKFAKILGKENVHNGFYGQEINITTYNLCRINMFLHDIDYNKFSIEHGDTLIDPAHMDEEPFEAIVSNPPYSIKWEGSDNGTLINDPRFSPAGVLAPKSKADFAFIMHALSWLAANGTAAIVCFPGIMYRSGAEQKIRKYLIDNNFMECIIQLPDNLFYGTTIATCIMVLKRGKKDSQTLFIDASNECVKATNSNKLDPKTNIENILTAYKNRTNNTHFTALVKKEDIEKADYNLSVSTYVESEDALEVINITELNAKIQEIIERENTLRAEIDAIIAEIEGA
ncbi:MAG: type I restriction-modification system subunit M [Bacteroides sp.]